MMQLIHGSVHCHGTGIISNCLNRLLHEVLGCASVIIVTIFFCKVKIMSLLEKLPQGIVPYLITELQCVQYIGVTVLVLLIWTVD
jgi:hypothetical protein